MTTKFKILSLIYGIVWLIWLSPFTIFVVFGCLTQQPVPSFGEVAQVFLGTGFYWCCMWLPTRKKMHKYDQWFVNFYFGRK